MNSDNVVWLPGNMIATTLVADSLDYKPVRLINYTDGIATVRCKY